MIVSYIEYENEGITTSINFPTDYDIFRDEKQNIQTKKNDQHIDKFFSDNIDYIYGIVGKNASGKTTLLKNIVKVMSGNFDGDYLIIFEENNRFFFLSKHITKKNLPDGFEKIIFNDFHSQDSIVFLTNMVDDNEIYSLFENIINISKTFLINEDGDGGLEGFFSKEMNRNIQFSSLFKDHVKIEEYINLPEDINYVIDSISIRYDEEPEFLKVLLLLGKKLFKSKISHVVMDSSFLLLDELYEKLKNTNPYINYDYLEANFPMSFGNNFNKAIRQISNILPKIMKLNITSKRGIDNSKKNLLENEYVHLL